MVVEASFAAIAKLCVLALKSGHSVEAVNAKPANAGLQARLQLPCIKVTILTINLAPSDVLIVSATSLGVPLIES